MVVDLIFKNCISKKNRKVSLIVNAGWLTLLLLNSKTLAKIIEECRKENEYLISINDSSDKF